MMTSEKIHALSDDERRAWEASLTGDEREILQSAPGHRYTLVFIAEVKWVLLSPHLPTRLRLSMLECLDRLSRSYSPAAIAAIQPMPDEGREIIEEARKLGDKWLDVVARWEVFTAFVAMNPTLLQALKMQKPSAESSIGGLQWTTN